MEKNFSRSKLLILFDRQKGKCAYCQDDLIKDCLKNKPPHIDHIKPKINGVDNGIDNLCLACSFCNLSKKTKNKIVFLDYLKPYLDGICEKKELKEYNIWKKLNTKFKNKQNAKQKI